MFKNSGYFNKIFYFLSVFLLVFFVANPVLAFIEIISIDSLGNQSEEQNEDDSFDKQSIVSDDGRYVIFSSDADNLVVGDSNALEDIFIRDRQLDTTEIISLNTTGVYANSGSVLLDASSNGRFIVFSSDATNLDEVLATTNGFNNIFIRDHVSGTTERVNLTSVGGESNADSFLVFAGAKVSDDGRYVFFTSASTNMVPSDTNGFSDVFVRDISLGTTERLSVSSLGDEATGGHSSLSAVSSSGRYVVFSSSATNLVPGDTNGQSDTFLLDRNTSTVSILSGVASPIFISSDARYLILNTDEDDLVLGDNNGFSDLFLYDRNNSSYELLSTNTQGDISNSVSGAIGISKNSDLRYVSFYSVATNLFPGVISGNINIYLRDRDLGTTILISKNSDGEESNGHSYRSYTNSDGRYTSFTSLSTDLFGGFVDQNQFEDIFLFDLNDPPSTITLDPSNIYENLPIGTVVGTLDATDPNTSDVLTYALTCDSPEGGDTLFEIVGDEVRTLEVFDYETQPLFDICVRVSDGNGGESQEVLTIFVLDAVPTDITLSNNSLNENNLVGANIGTLSTTISEAGSTFTYSFSCGVPGADDSSFSISGDSLNTLVSFDFETKSSYVICIESQDDVTTESFSKNFTINVLDVNEGGGSSGGSGNNPNPIWGCTDSDATNYNPSANRDNGSCIYTPGAILGCTDSLAGNYNILATVDDGSCLYGVFGCMDPLALNYNQLAVHSNNSCQYSPVVDPGENNPIYGCMEVSATNYNPSANRDDGSCNFLIPVVYGCKDITAENYSVYATQDDGSCIYTNFIPENPDGGGDPENPGVNIPITGIINEIPEDLLKSVTVAGIIIPSFLISLLQPGLIAGAISVPLRIWNLIPVLMGYRRKKRPWGTIYDSVTKQPLDPVYVTIKSAYGQEVSTSITDMDGRFGFLVPAGKYFISANKANYIFPSVKLAGKEKDELYENLYFGGEIEVKEKEDVVFKNIPMDAINFNWNEFEKAQNKKLMKFYSKRDLFFARISTILFVSGFISSIILFFLNNSILNSVILGLYLVIVSLRFFGIKPRQSGRVTDKEGYPLSFAVLKLFSAELGREVAHSVVGKTGRYYMLVPNGQYYMKVSKKTGEDSYEEIYTSQSIKIDSGYVRENIVV